MIGELLFVGVIAASAIGLFTFVDATFHDGYAMPAAAECYTSNTSTFCDHFRQLHNCTAEQGYNCLMQAYWNMLAIQMLWLGGILMFARLGLAKMAQRKINATRIFGAIVWGAVPVILLFTAWEDYLYYAARNLPLPATLPWLDNAGLMPNINHVLGSSTTTQMSLFVLMGIGATMIIGLFIAKLAVQRHAGLKTPL